MAVQTARNEAPTPLHELTATELAKRIRSGELSSVEVVEAHIRRIEEVNPTLNAVVMPLFDQARREAAEADAAQRRGESLGPLHGVPVTIKDQFHVRGLPTTFGLQRLRDAVATEDGPMVAALRRAGAIVLGKTNVPQTLAVVETDNALFGRTNNPWDPSRTPGGSSGGEAAIIAAGGSPLGLGGDFGGSLRVPAAWCGLYTIKPTARRLPTDPPPVRVTSEGIIPKAGPLARSTADVTLALRVMIDAVNARPSGASPPVPFRDPGEVDVGRLRIAVLSQVGSWCPSPAVRRALAEAASALRTAGCTVEEWQNPPDPAEGVRLFFRVAGADGFSFCRQILAGESPIPLMKPTVQLTSMPSLAASLLCRLLRSSGQAHLAEMLGSAKKQSAEGLLNVLGDRMAYEQRFIGALDEGGYDALLLPPLPLAAIRHGDSERLADFWGSILLFNSLGMPAGVVPATRVRPGEESDRPPSKDKAEQVARAAEEGSAGLPVGVQVAARHWREDIVLAVMGALEKHFRAQPDYPVRPPL